MHWRVGGCGGCVEVWSWGRMEQLPVQILVVVASIQMRTLKTEVGKGSMWTVIGHGLVDPKLYGNSEQREHWGGSSGLLFNTLFYWAKGKQLNIAVLQSGSGWQHYKRLWRCWWYSREEFSFLFNSKHVLEWHHAEIGCVSWQSNPIFGLSDALPPTLENPA